MRFAARRKVRPWVQISQLEPIPSGPLASYGHEEGDGRCRRRWRSIIGSEEVAEEVRVDRGDGNEENQRSKKKKEEAEKKNRFDRFGFPFTWPCSARLPTYVGRYVLCSPPVCVTRNYGVYLPVYGDGRERGGRTKEKVDEEETKNGARKTGRGREKGDRDEQKKESGEESEGRETNGP